MEKPRGKFGKAKEMPAWHPPPVGETQHFVTLAFQHFWHFGSGFGPVRVQEAGYGVGLAGEAEPTMHPQPSSTRPVSSQSHPWQRRCRSGTRQIDLP